MINTTTRGYSGREIESRRARTLQQSLPCRRHSLYVLVGVTWLDCTKFSDVIMHDRCPLAQLPLSLLWRHTKLCFLSRALRLWQAHSCPSRLRVHPHSFSRLSSSFSPFSVVHFQSGSPPFCAGLSSLHARLLSPLFSSLQ